MTSQAEVVGAMVEVDMVEVVVEDMVEVVVEDMVVVVVVDMRAVEEAASAVTLVAGAVVAEGTVVGASLLAVTGGEVMELNLKQLSVLSVHHQLPCSPTWMPIAQHHQR